jgi:hypothetical protein
VVFLVITSISPPIPPIPISPLSISLSLSGILLYPLIPPTTGEEDHLDDDDPIEEREHWYSNTVSRIERETSETSRRAVGSRTGEETLGETSLGLEWGRIGW